MRNWWRVAFLAVTAMALLMELFASFDGNPNTDPWTELITTYIPAEIAFAAIGALCLWLVVHFGRRYLRKRNVNKALEGHEERTQGSPGDSTDRV